MRFIKAFARLFRRHAPAVHPDCKNSASLDHGTGSPGSAATKASNLHLQLERGPRANGAPPRSSAPVTFDFHSPACGAGESPSILAEPRAITKTDDGVRGCAAPGTGARSRTPVPSRLLSRKAPSVRSPTPTKLDHEASPGRHSPLTTENFRAPHRSLQGASAGTNTATGRLGASDKGSACRTGANGAASVLVRSRPGQGSLYRACSLRNKLADSVKGSLDGGLFESEDSDVFGMAPAPRTTGAPELSDKAANTHTHVPHVHAKASAVVLEASRRSLVGVVPPVLPLVNPAVRTHAATQAF